MTQGKGRLPAELPFLPLYNQVLLPGGFARVAFKRSGPVSGPLIEHLLAQQGEQVLVAAVPVLESDTSKQVELQPESEDADTVKHKEIAAAARVLNVFRDIQTGVWVVTLEGWCRLFVEDAPEEGQHKFLSVSVKQAGPFKDARVKEEDLDKEGQELANALRAGTRRLTGFLNSSVGSPVNGGLADGLQKLSAPAAADALASMLTRDTAFKQLVLEAVDPNERMRLVVGLLQQTLDTFRGNGKRSPEDPHDDSQKQLAIRIPPWRLMPGLANKVNVGDPEEEDEEELSVLMQRLRAAKPPAEVLKVASREHRRLKKSSEHHPGYAMSRAYLETLADLPWNTFSGQAAPDKPDMVKNPKAGSSDADSTATNTSKEEGLSAVSTDMAPSTLSRHAPQFSLAEARELLDKDHYGLDKVKDRIVQYLAVRRLRGADARAPILCFVGPPGTGKTSLASSISKVLLRPFQRVSVGGVRDEAEIRGHRRTYIGAMPGRIIQALRRSGVRDPVLLLDEVDKMGHDSLRGDPASALLEVLDPNQNQAFVDTYLSVPFDLSQVVFVATANQLQHMSAPLLDRLEIIQLSGYTLEEKRHIAQRHLIPGLLAEHGLSPNQLLFPEDAILLVADGYTREAGVRSLSRNLAAICRHVAVQIVSEHDKQEQVASSSDSDDISHNFPQADQSQAAGHSHQQRPAELGHDPASTTGSQQYAATSAGSSAIQQDWESPTTATSGGFFWGSLWGGLKGAFTPPRQPPPPRQHQPHDPYQHQHTAQQGNHKRLRSVDTHILHTSDAYASSGSQLQAGSEHSVSHTPQVSKSVVSLGTAGSVDGKQQLSNPYGGVNADMTSLAHTEVPFMTVTAQLIEKVLGPRKYNENDSADSLVAPGSAAGLVWTAVGGQVQYVECCCTSTGQPHRPGKLVLTGQVGEVLQESAHLALSWIRSHTHQLAAAAAASHATASPAQALNNSQPAASPADAASIGECSQRLEGYGSSSLSLPAKAVSAHSCQHETMLADSRQLPSEACASSAGDAQAAVYDKHLCNGDHSCHSVQSSAAGLSRATSNYEEEVGSSETVGKDAVSQADVSTAAAQWDVHVHLPAGAVSKDGPSAGITLATAMVSLFLGRCVRADTAMTGELTLRGLVLPIGGLKEKLLAAHHAGVKRVLVPKRNWRDVQADVPVNIRDSLDIIPVHVLEDVLQHAFDPPLVLKSLAKL